MTGLSRTSGIWTFVLIAVTAISKFFGFIRELLLLSDVGLSFELDAFVLLFTISNLLAGVVGTLVFTNIAPTARGMVSNPEKARLVGEGIRVGLQIFATTLILNVGIAFSFFQQDYTFEVYILLPLIISGLSFFVVLGEFQAALFVAWSRRTPVIFGNIIITVPLIVLLFFADLTILTYAIGLLVAFATRTLIWMWIAGFRFWNISDFVNGFSQASRLFKDAWRAVSGSSATTTLQLAVFVLMLFSQSLGEGAASTFSYAFRLPYLLISTVWFVFGLKFFSDIIEFGVGQLMRKVGKLTMINGLSGLCLGAFCYLYMWTFPFLERYPVIADPAYLDFVSLSIWALPICIFFPLVEMAQRSLVVIEAHYAVSRIAGFTLAVLFVVTLSALFVTNPIWLVIFLSLVSGLSGIFALRTLVIMIDRSREDP